MKEKSKQKVFVAMSGGVDSSVAAYLLKKQGFNVTGVYMKNWSEESHRGKLDKYCPWKKDVSDVRSVCEKLNIPFKVYNFEKQYNRQVIDYFFDGEMRGQTPNPDVVCNREIKFGLFLKKALSEGADCIATGHYARLRRFLPHPAFSHPLRYRRGVGGEVSDNPGKYFYQLLQAKDKNKDQSYFLCLLTQKQLSKSLFPLGNLAKPEVREIARKAGLSTAEKPESMGICFVGEVKLNDFLRTRLTGKPGDIVNEKGVIVGQHNGLPFYTIGQRHGLNLGGGLPYYVSGKELKDNRLIVARGESNPALFKKSAFVKNISWISDKPPRFPFACKVRHRHRQELQAASLNKSGNKIIVRFRRSQRAVTPGQFCAFYKGSEVIGGGEIVN